MVTPMRPRMSPVLGRGALCGFSGLLREDQAYTCTGSPLSNTCSS